MIEGLISGTIVGLAESRQGNTRPALDMVATQVLTVYHALQKHASMPP